MPESSELIFILFAHAIFIVDVWPTAGNVKVANQAGSQAPGSSAQGKACAACLTRNNHDVTQCPLLAAIATGSEEGISQGILPRVVQSKRS